MLKVGVLVSGGGTNLQAILDAQDAGKITNAQVALVVSNNAGAYALKRAKDHQIPAVCISPKDYDTREDFHQALLRTLQEAKIDLVVLAGFLVAIPSSIVEVGYYGLHVHEEALKRGVKVTGATVHFVDTGTDTGPIILQKAVDIEPDDTPKTLQRRVMERAEWKLLPKAIQLIANGRVTVENGIVTISE